jgi:[ribosomal protein S18]-alanine N-acetyltransferase
VKDLMLTPLVPEGLAMRPLNRGDLVALDALEQAAYAFPWSRQHFVDSFQSGYHMQGLLKGRDLKGYFVAMLSLDEVHLLNIAVHPEDQGKGYARLMLSALIDWAHAKMASAIWLEVRASNHRASSVYKAAGFSLISIRKNYYPDVQLAREDGIVMWRSLVEPGNG